MLKIKESEWQRFCDNAEKFGFEEYGDAYQIEYENCYGDTAILEGDISSNYPLINYTSEVVSKYCGVDKLYFEKTMNKLIKLKTEKSNKKENGTMKLIEIYKANQINKIEKEYEKKCEEIIANDLLNKEVLEIFKETNDKYATALEKYNVKPDGELYLRNKSVEAYTEETGKLFKLAENEKDHAITELQIMFKEVEAQLELCNGDYDKTISILKTYGILDQNGKVVK